MSLQASLSGQLVRLQLDCPVLSASLAAPGRADAADLVPDAADEGEPAAATSGS